MHVPCAAVREGSSTWPGGRTWFRVRGDLDGGATPLVALHGGPGSTHHYFAPLERLAAERPVVVYDQAGCGRSEKAPERPWSVALFLDELAALRAELRLDEIHLLGTSWGGMLALEHALSGAGGLRSLVLSSTLASAAQWAAEARRLRDALPPDVVAELDRLEAAEAWDDPAYEAALDEFDARHVHRGARDTPEIERMQAEKSREAYRAMWGPNEWTMTGALGGWDVRARLGEIRVPCLVVRGAHDLCTERVADTLVRGLPDARLVVFEESSHTPVLEETERYLAEVSAFLRDAERPA
jgi:proline-specific peptidase